MRVGGGWLPAGLLGVLVLAGCGVGGADYDALRAENDSLAGELAAREARAARPQPVRLARTEQFELASARVDDTFQIKVSVPRGYEPEAGPYPVLYVTDAETNFGAVAYIVQRLIKDGLIPEILVVGVAYGTDYDTFYDLRSRDLTPSEVPSVRVGGATIVHPTGGADPFASFLEQELFPAIEQRYPADPDDRAIYGHSYGGLFGCYVFLNRPELFRRYLVLSPSLWFDGRLLLRQARSRTPASLAPPTTVLYMATGRLEGRMDDDMLAFARAVRDGVPAGLAIRAEVLDDETHRTVFGRGFTNGLRFIYGQH